MSLSYDILCQASPSTMPAYIQWIPRETSQRRHSGIPKSKMEPDSLGLVNNERRGVFFPQIFFLSLLHLGEPLVAASFGLRHVPWFEVDGRGPN